MALKVDWDKSNKEFYVKIGQGRRKVFKTSTEAREFMESVTDSPWQWTRAAKKQIEKE
jgi:hypothetical protein